MYSKLPGKSKAEKENRSRLSRSAATVVATRCTSVIIWYSWGTPYTQQEGEEREGGEREWFTVYTAIHSTADGLGPDPVLDTP